MKSFVLADDLTGALEVGGSFRERGHDVVVDLNSTTSTGAGELEIVTTETRNAAPDEGAKRVRGVLEQRYAAGETLLLKKIDSTLRGPLAAEIAALIEIARPPLVVLCPSNPAVGRTVIDGQLLVQGVPLAETDFKNDPAWPARQSNVSAWLVPTFGAVNHLSLADLRSGSTPGFFREAHHAVGQVVVCDSETAADLSALAGIVTQTCPGAVFVGSNGLGRALAELHPPAAPAPTSTAPTFDSLLIVCGSRHPASHRQIDRLARRSDVVVVSMEHDIAPSAAANQIGLAFTRARVVAVRMQREAEIAPALLLARLSAMVAPLPRLTGVFFTGGETAFACLRALGGQRLRVQHVWEQAVVFSHMERTGARTGAVTVLTKPGGYGDDDTLDRLLGYCMK